MATRRDTKETQEVKDMDRGLKSVTHEEQTVIDKSKGLDHSQRNTNEEQTTYLTCILVLPRLFVIRHTKQSCKVDVGCKMQGCRPGERGRKGGRKEGRKERRRKERNR